MQLSRPDPLGIQREVAWAPTDDTARQRGLEPDTLFSAGRQWTPTGLMALGHQLTVNIATGGLVVSINDLGMPYHALRFQIARSLDVQEQHAQQAYLEANPNTDPRIHLFANWQFVREAVVSEVWNQTFPELLLADGDGDGALYYRSYPGFGVNRTSQADVEDTLRAYGVPGRTLAALDWRYDELDSVLRSRQGSFSVLSGRYDAETMVDPAVVRLYRFDVTAGVGYRYSSDFAYQQLIDAGGSRETTVQSLVVDAVDALGHRVAFAPIETQPPYRHYRLQDGSGRAYEHELDNHVDYVDGERPGGKVKTYVVSHVTDQTRSADNVVDYLYESGRLVEVRYAGHAGGPPRVYRYAYDEGGNLVGITDPVGDSFTIEYVEDLLDADEQLIPRLKVSRMVDGEGNSASYAYDHAHRTVTVTFAGVAGDVRTAVYSYMEDGNDTRQRYITEQSVTVTRGYSGDQVVDTIWHYTADGHYDLQAVIDPLGHTTSFDYNDFGQVTRTTDATGHQRDYQYDIRAGPTAADPNRYDLLSTSETNVDADGNTFAVQSRATYMPYDATTSTDTADAAQSTHRVQTKSNELGAVSSFAYDDAGSFFPLRPTRATDPLGDVTIRAYDATGALIQDTDAEGDTWRRAYNARGQLVSLTDPNGFTRSWVYDRGSGWLTDRTDALGAAPGDADHSAHYEWTPAGQRARDRDPSGATIEYAYYADKRIRAVTRHDPAPQSVRFTFDATGGVTAITDPRGHTTFFESDEAGRVYATYRDAPANPPIRLAFDPAGRPVEVTDRNGQTTRYAYDALGRPISVQEPPWPAAAATNPGKSVTIGYDHLGHRLRVTDSELPHDYVYAYDAAGNQTRTQDAFAGQLMFGYDARNDLIHIDDGAAVIDLRFHRDHAGRVSRITDSGWRDPSRTFHFAHKHGALLDNLYRIDGPSGLATRFAYNANRQIQEVVHEQGGSALGSYGYAYRSDGLLGQTTGDHAGQYDYDGMKRLIKETDAGVADGYDGAGNRLWRSPQPPSAGQQNVYDADNRLTETPHDGAAYSYDNNGNLLLRQPGAGAGTEHQYDGANRLRRVRRGAITVEYLYDIDGRLLEQRRTSGQSTETSRYRHGNRGILAALDANDNIHTLYTRGDQGRLLRRRTATALNPAPSSDSHSLYYIHDGFGSVVGLLDWDGSKHLSASYDAWGRASTQGAASGDPFRYRGALQDADTGLLLLGRRWLDPTLGRWITQDPLLGDLLAGNHDVLSALAEIANLYLYVGADPLNHADPTGLGPSWIDRLKANFAGKVLAAWMKGRDIDKARFQPKGTRTEQVEKKAPPEQEEEAAGPDPAPEPGAGEGSRAPSTERTYADAMPQPDPAGGGGGPSAKAVAGGGMFATIAIGVWEVIKWTGAAAAGPESGGASFGAAAALP